MTHVEESRSMWSTIARTRSPASTSQIIASICGPSALAARSVVEHNGGMPDAPDHHGTQVSKWYATDDHPRGADAKAIFEVVGSMVYPGAGHPSGDGIRPWYQVRAGVAYPVDGHPSGVSAEPAFRVVDDLVYPAAADVVATDVPAWFEIRPGL